MEKTTARLALHKCIYSSADAAQKAKKTGAIPAYLHSSKIQVTTTQRKGRGKKEVFDLRAIGSAEDVEQRLQAQLNGPRAMFSSEGAVSVSRGIAISS